MDFPASVKPTKSRAPIEPVVPVSGMLINSDVPSEKVMSSSEKKFWTAAEVGSEELSGVWRR